MHGNAGTAADIADDRIARHRVAALGKTHQHAVHAGNGHAAGGKLCLGLFLHRLLDFCFLTKILCSLRMQHGIEPVQHLARRNMGIA